MSSRCIIKSNLAKIKSEERSTTGDPKGGKEGSPRGKEKSARGLTDPSEREGKEKSGISEDDREREKNFIDKIYKLRYINTLRYGRKKREDLHT